MPCRGQNRRLRERASLTRRNKISDFKTKTDNRRPLTKMERGKWEQVKDIFDAALRCTADERERVIIENCRGDEELRREVESLLSSFNSANSFLQKPAVGEVAEIVVGENNQLAGGQRFGHYEIVRQLGAGGMGEVYLARDVKLNRRVALKVLPENLSGETDANRRLVREAQAAATLDHPNICQIYEIAETGSSTFIVMQYVSGETLAAKLAKERLSLQTSLDLAIQIADALAEAHAHHIIHRDIKPANIIINDRGQAKVLDFGLAKFVRVESEEETEQMLSKPGAIMGTVPYMSPEQVRGGTLDARSDIFSFGALVYEMLGGKQPFARENNAETISAILGDEPRWTEIPPKLQPIVKKSLAKNRDEHYQSARDLVHDLSSVRQSGENVNTTDSQFWDAETTALPKISTKDVAPQTTQQTTQRRNFRLTMLATLIAVVVLAGFGYGLYRFINSVGKSSAFLMSNVTRLTSNGNTRLAAVSPDGRFVAYVIVEAGQPSLWLKNIQTGSDVQILPPSENVPLHSLTFSPDGNNIYYAVADTLYQLPILGGAPKRIVGNFNSVYQYNPITFSPDRKQFAFIRHLPEQETAALIIANADGTKERTLALDKGFLRSAAWSPDGKVIAIVTGKIVVAVRVADSVVSPVSSPNWNNVQQVVWLPDGESLLVTASENRSSIANKIWQLSYPGGEARKITDDSNSYNSISLTSDGRGLVTVQEEQMAHVWQMTGTDASQAKQLTRGFNKYDGIFGLDYLASGKIVYETAPNDEGEVWIMDADGRNTKRLLDESGASCASPDGKYLVFQSDDGAGTGLFRLNLSDGERKRLTTGTDVWATFSPDNQWIVFTRWGEKVNLWKVSIDGGEAIKMTDNTGFALAPTVSPDGKLIAFYWGKRERKQMPEIALLPFGGGEITRTFKIPIQYGQGAGKNTLQWTPDGRAVSYSDFRDGVTNIWRQPIDGSPPVQITNFTSGQIFNFAYSPRRQTTLSLSRHI